MRSAPPLPRSTAVSLWAHDKRHCLPHTRQLPAIQRPVAPHHTITCHYLNGCSTPTFCTCTTPCMAPACPKHVVVGGSNCHSDSSTRLRATPALLHAMPRGGGAFVDVVNLLGCTDRAPPPAACCSLGSYSTFCSQLIDKPVSCSCYRYWFGGATYTCTALRAFADMTHAPFYAFRVRATPRPCHIPTRPSPACPPPPTCHHLPTTPPVTRRLYHLATDAPARARCRLPRTTHILYSAALPALPMYMPPAVMRRRYRACAFCAAARHTTRACRWYRRYCGRCSRMVGCGWTHYPASLNTMRNRNYPPPPVPAAYPPERSVDDG